MSIVTTQLKTRLAPSPTGLLHLGHVLHLIYVQGISRKLGATINLRIEDHDRIRCLPQYDESLLQDLEWLGFDIPTKLWRQSERHQVYQNELEKLMNRNLVYVCRCSRKDVQSSTGQNGGELVYPGTCRTKNYPFGEPNTCVRLKLDQIPTQDGQESPSPIQFRDLFLGDLGQNLTEQGDVVVQDRFGQWTYQFAVVIDDLEQQINLIIRGQDLLSSTGRQLAMRALIDSKSTVPIFAHHPLLLDEDGQKLAKRRSSEAISYLRRMGLSADEVRGLAAYMGGLIPDRRPISVKDDVNLNIHKV